MSEAPDVREPQALAWSQRVSWISLGALVVLFSWINVTSPTGSWLRWAVQALPLLMFVPGMLAKSHRAYSWLCFVIILYLIPAITQAVMLLGFRNAETPPGHWSDLLILLLTSVLFFSAVLSSRWLQRYQYSQFVTANGARNSNEQQ
ncbi:DUF2069 domain-containing protein [Gilvimarinus sp. F26214L]|uniref:DUF2069 domain-containing protein n=1 Tax=Gilvimarinus sp. DZF01 TaxID=3461371 RepID=UPI00404544A4